VDVKRAADLYAQSKTLDQVAAELGVTETPVSDQLGRASHSHQCRLSPEATR
jgi:hypothetical protein